ncbi:hypothetical protein FPOAC2_09442 [Fusarium poae]|uniref:Uncharacterized protein n=1 Tax=Fusarium poae TaxID=36050 RepID=A0A1B8APK6_FUSPO|nr:hypothetical protein FPOAC1_009506 [Fusarium poae]KAG8670103.1 hypothetical protein FPOAC1_009506 [Fusarium poae]OBS22304.1 hypothetical protein FPOA_08640 [Fusarium poae]
MKFTTLITTLLSITTGAQLASAACCDLKVCDGFNLKGRCKTSCYQYTNTPIAINGDGLKGPIASGKTDTDCRCTLGKDNQSCMLVNSNKRGTNAPNHCLTGIAFAQCQRA